MNPITPQTKTAPVVALVPEPNSIQAPSILLMGETGGGKTHSIVTLLQAGLEVFVIGTEPTFLDSILDAIGDNREYLQRFHWKAIQPSRVGIKGLQDMVKQISKMAYDDLSKLRPDSGRSTAQLITFLNTLEDFKDDATGKSFGSVESWGPDRVLVVDSLSGLNLMCMDVTIGNKVTAHQGEWGIAMGTLEKLLHNLTSNLNCFFVLIAHTEREGDEISQGTKVMVSTLGRKLAPKVPRFFSEVVLAYREGDKFMWSTTAVGVVLKRRALPLDGKLQPSFKPIVEAHHRRMAMLSKGKA
jgi:hypothetical protein